MRYFTAGLRVFENITNFTENSWKEFEKFTEVSRAVLALIS